MKYSLIIIFALHFSGLIEVVSQPIDTEVTKTNTMKLETDTISVTLEYYGWGCPCPQWITPENKIIYESKDQSDTNRFSDMFWHVRPANTMLDDPFDLMGDLEHLVLEFTGQFYSQPQYLGIEGEQKPAKTLLYYSVKK